MSVPKVISLKYSPDSIRAALITLKGAEKGPATFEAVAPAFSALIASGGNKVEFSATSATAQVFIELHSDKVKTPVARAWRACAVLALQGFKADGRAKDQASHDARLMALCGAWCAFFKDASPKAKPADYESPSAKIARLEAENASLRIERDALSEVLQSLRTADKALATA